MSGHLQTYLGLGILPQRIGSRVGQLGDGVVGWVKGSLGDGVVSWVMEWLVG